MRLCRFLVNDRSYFGMVEGDRVHTIGPDLFTTPVKSGDSYPLADVQLLSPTQPSKLVAVGLNYVDHIREFGRTEIPTEPVVFFKAPSSLIGHGMTIVLPNDIGQIDYEAELGVVIKKRARKISEAEAPEYILGLTCVNDVTARTLQKRDAQWARAKSYDTFAPVGPWVAVGASWAGIKVEARVNGELRQSGNTKDMIFSIPFLVSFISKAMTLFPGDIISTGTPVGVGPLKAGDVVEVSIEGIGTLRNPVTAE